MTGGSAPGITSNLAATQLPPHLEALILDSIIRARYRQGLDREVPLEKGKVVPVRIDLFSTAIVFNRGHRVALHLTSSNDPRFDPNPNTGKPLRADKETRVATNTIHFGTRYPSRLLLPVTREHEVPTAKTSRSK